MNILLISHFQLSNDLTSHRSVNFGKYLAEAGHHVTHISISPNLRFKYRTGMFEGMKTIETPDLFWGRGRTGWDPWDTLFRIFKMNFNQMAHMDIVHGFECRPVTIFPILFQKLRKKEIIFISDWEDWWGRGGLIDENRPRWYRYSLGPVETYFEEAFRTKANGVTVISSALEERAVKLGVNRKEICKIPGGVHIDLFKPIPMQEARDELGLSRQIKIAIFSAQVLIDLELILSAFSNVCQSFPDSLLLLTGRNYELTIKLVQKYQLEDKVSVLGLVPINEFPTYLASADVCLLPFQNKIANLGRWPNKVGEYMSIGRPIVSNPVGEIKKLFEKENIGLLANDDPMDFAEKIIHLFENPGLCEEMGDNGRRVAEEQFAWPLIINKLEKFYHQYI